MYEKLRKVRIESKIPLNEILSTLDLKVPSAYYRKETGMIKFSLEEAKKLADLFKKPIEEIFFEHEVSITETQSA